MNTYEFTFLVDDAKGLKQVEKALESHGGKKLSEKPWGKRLLAFPINNLTAAEYYTWTIQMEAKQVDTFKKILNYDKLVMRYLILGQDDMPEAPVKAVKKEKKTE